MHAILTRSVNLTARREAFRQRVPSYGTHAGGLAGLRESFSSRASAFLTPALYPREERVTATAGIFRVHEEPSP